MSQLPLVLTCYTLVNALGQGVAASLEALRQGRSGLRNNDYEPAPLPTWIGRVDEIERTPLPAAFADYECRNNRLARLALEQDGFSETVVAAVKRHGASRIGLFLGTSTSGIEETERAYAMRNDAGALPADYRYRHTQNPYSLGAFSRAWLGLEGPAMVISTACSSSAKVFATASRYIAAGLCDAAVVGGVDSLCQTTLYGFNSLELVSSDKCRPWDAERNGINIGEGAGFALLERADRAEGTVRLLGYGESSDAYHMSTPHPQGDGAVAAMQQALSRAGIGPEAVDYINLHGTATPSNDRSEDRAVVRLFGTATACSSTKGWTGHTLGAAGITEAIFAALTIEHGFMPASLNTVQKEAGLEAGILLQNQERPVKIAMSNSFGFGGSNCSLVLGRSEG